MRVREPPHALATAYGDSFIGRRNSSRRTSTGMQKEGTFYSSVAFFLMREKDPGREIFTNGVYMIRNGQVTRVIGDMPNTNGLVFSPDEDALCQRQP